MRNKKYDGLIGFLVGIGAPLFSIAVALESFPALQEIGDVTNPAWRIVVMRAITFGVIINAVLFFTSVNSSRDSIAKGILLSCIPSVIAVFYFQFVLS